MRALAIALLATGCAGTMEEYFAQDVVEMHLDLPYVAGDNIRQRLDLFLPREVDNFPVAVFVHGGFWIHQDKNFFQPFVGIYKNVGIALAREGIGTAVIAYRLVPDVTFDEEFGDVATAIAWTHDHIGSYGGDAANMVIVGHSAGGHMTALAGLDDARLTAAGMDVTAIKGYAPLSPILDVQQLAMDPPSDNATIVEQVFHGDIARNSPVTYFRAGITPMLVVLGGEDLSALRKQVPPAVAALAATGAPVTLAELPGKNHEDIVVDFDTDADAVTPVLAAFIHDHTH
ncbi:MAG: alpha/beta hydrolase [Polyangiales bacterium]